MGNLITNSLFIPRQLEKPEYVVHVASGSLVCIKLEGS